jgi:hypothetical protein
VGSQQRRQAMQKRLDYFNDKQDTYLQEALQEQFEYPERLKLQREFFNVTKLMINELAVLYNEDPLREIKDGKESDKELFQDILDNTNLNNTLQTVNEFVKLLKTVLVKAEWNEEDGRVVFRIFTPNMFDVIMDEQDPSKAKAIIYSKNYPDPSSQFYGNDDKVTNKDDFGESDTVFHCWTDKNYFMFTYQMNQRGEAVAKLIDNPNNPSNINPYGTLGIFVAFRDSVVIDDFFAEGGDDLIVTNESINIKLTELNYLIKMQSFSIPVRKGANETAPVILDPSMTIDLPADDDMGKSDFKFVSPDAKIMEVQSEIEQKLRRIALKYKMNPDMFTSSGNKSSSESLQLQNYAQGRLIKKDKPYFRKCETQLFKMIKLVNNTHNKIKFSDKAWLFVDFRDSEMPMTQTDKDAHMLTLFNNGLISKAEWLLEENPDLGDVETAQKKINELEASAPKPMMLNQVDQGQDNSKDDNKDDTGNDTKDDQIENE